MVDTLDSLRLLLLLLRLELCRLSLRWLLYWLMEIGGYLGLFKDNLHCLNIHIREVTILELLDDLLRQILVLLMWTQEIVRWRSSVDNGLLTFIDVLILKELLLRW